MIGFFLEFLGMSGSLASTFVESSQDGNRVKAAEIPKNALARGKFLRITIDILPSMFPSWKGSSAYGTSMN